MHASVPYQAQEMQPTVHLLEPALVVVCGELEPEFPVCLPVVRCLLSLVDQYPDPLADPLVVALAHDDLGEEESGHQVDDDHHLHRLVVGYEERYRPVLPQDVLRLVLDERLREPGELQRLGVSQQQALQLRLFQLQVQPP